MNLPNELPVLVLVILMTSSLNLSAQQDNTSVILYNSQPVEVELSEVGKILNFYGLMPGYMEGYNLGNDIAAVDLPNDNFSSSYFDDNSKNAEYDIVSQERIEIDFDSNFATLSNVAISNLNEVASSLKTKKHSKVLLTVYSLSGEPSKLLENRLNSASAYLNIKGVSSDQIATDINISTALVDKITINYID